jgi:hypothetical protein
MGYRTQLLDYITEYIYDLRELKSLLYMLECEISSVSEVRGGVPHLVALILRELAQRQPTEEFRG